MNPDTQYEMQSQDPTSSRISRLTETLHELEGLLQLCTNTPGLLPATFGEILTAKAAAVAAMTRELAAGLRSEPHAVSHPVSVDTPAEPQTSSLTRSPAEKQTGTEVPKREIRLSINDRIRFSREIFGGDTAALNALTESLSSLSEWTQAPAVIAGATGLDPDSDLLREFTELLSARYTDTSKR